MENIIHAIKTTSGMSDHALTELTSHFLYIELPRKHLLVEAGKLNRNFYFLEKGISRCFAMVDGKEITTWFSKEGDTLFSMLGCYYSKPSHDYIQLLEKSHLYYLPIETLNELYKSNIEIANWGRLIHQKAFLEMELRHIDRLGKSARERYKMLLATQPDLFQRVNLGYIASYLGISQVTLCAIRNEE